MTFYHFVVLSQYLGVMRSLEREVEVWLPFHGDSWEEAGFRYAEELSDEHHSYVFGNEVTILVSRLDGTGRLLRVDSNLPWKYERIGEEEARDALWEALRGLGGGR